jgi:cation diffusion facilitator family transporter
LGISILLQSIERLVSIEHVEEPKLVFILGCVGFGLNVITAAFLHGKLGIAVITQHSKLTRNVLPEHHHHHSSKDTEQGLEAGGNTESPASVVSFHLVSSTLVVVLTYCKQTDDLHHQHRHVGLAIKRPGRDLGMLGALLHVVGDALNNLGVIVAALVIWLSPSSDRYYADPAIGLVISLMILFSAYPLVKQSGTILLQSAPEGVNLTDIRHDIEKVCFHNKLAYYDEAGKQGY